MAYIVKQKMRGGKVHVHLAENQHVPELGQPRQTRQHLGTLDLEKNELLLSRKIETLSPNIVELLRKKGIAYNARRAPKPGRTSLRCSDRPLKPAEVRDLSVVDVGEMHTLTYLCNKHGLIESLKAFGEEDAQALLALAIWQACTGDAQYLAENWLDTRPLSDAIHEFDFSSPSLSEFMENVGQAQTLQREFYKRWLAACGYPSSIVYDTTSISTYSENLDMAEWGYNRDKESLQQVNWAMAVTAQTGIPLTCRLLSGSISDVRTLLLTGELLNEYGLKEFYYSLDRGFFSNSNLAAMLEQGISFLIRVPFTTNQSKQLLKQHHKKLQSIQSSIEFSGRIYRHARAQWRVKMKDQEDKDIPAFFFFDPETAAGQTANFEKRILKIKALSDEEDFQTEADAQQWLCENSRGLKKYLEATSNSGKIELRINAAAVDEAVQHFGVALYVAHGKEIGPNQVLTDARGRDVVEKVFDLVKNENGQKRLRTGKDVVAQGRIFLAFLSAIVRTLLGNALNNADMKKKPRTIDEALALLRKVRRIDLSDGRSLLQEIPKKTRDLMEALEIPRLK